MKSPVPSSAVTERPGVAVNRGIARDLHFDPLHVIGTGRNLLELRCLKPQANQGRQRIAQLAIHNLGKAVEAQPAVVGGPVMGASLALKADIPRRRTGQLNPVAALVSAGAFALGDCVNLCAV